MIRLTPSQRLDTLHVREEAFIRFLKISFAQKRKTLWNNLKSEYPADGLKRAMAKTRLQASVRAEALSLEQSATFFRALSSDGANSTQS